jgi:hypothetical protein
MYLLKVVQVGFRSLLDPLVPSIIKVENVKFCNVTKMLLNHIAVLIQVQVEINIFPVPLIRNSRLMASTAFDVCHPFSLLSLFKGIYALQPKDLNFDTLSFTL